MNIPLLLGISQIFGCLLQYSSNTKLKSLDKLIQNSTDTTIGNVLQDLMKVFGYNEKNADDIKKLEHNSFEEKTNVIINIDGKFLNLHDEITKYYNHHIGKNNTDSHKDYDLINKYLIEFLKLSLPQAYHILQHLFQKPYVQLLIQGAQELQKYYSFNPLLNRSVACINIIKDTCSLIVSNGLHFISSDNSYSNFIAPIKNVIQNTLVQNSPDNISVFLTSLLGQIGSASPIQTNVEICGEGLGIKILSYILSKQEQITKDYKISPLLGDNIVKNIELFENSLSPYIPAIYSYKKEFQEFLVGALIGDKYTAETREVLQGFLKYWMKDSKAPTTVASNNKTPKNLLKATKQQSKNNATGL